MQMLPSLSFISAPVKRTTLATKNGIYILLNKTNRIDATAWKYIIHKISLLCLHFF